MSTKKSKQYGVFYGRFQPFHKSHKAIIEQIIKDGLIPIIFLGSAQESRTQKNPYTVQERFEMIKLCFPNTNIIVLPLYDNKSDTKWFKSMINTLVEHVTPNTNLYTFYSFNKDEDRCDFKINGIPYINSFYSNAFSLNGFKTKDITNSFDIPIRATQIREDLEKYKEFLEPEVCDYIKNIKLNLKDTE